MFKSKLFKNLMVFGIIAILSVPLFSSNFSLKANDDCGLAKVKNYSNLNALSAAGDLNGGWKIFSWKIWDYAGNAFAYAYDWIYDKLPSGYPCGDPSDIDVERFEDGSLKNNLKVKSDLLLELN